MGYRRIVGLLPAVIVALAASSYGVYGQCQTEVKFSRNGKSPIAVYGLMRSYRGYTKRNYVGRIAHVQYERNSGVEIVGFALELSDGVRKSVDITHDDCVSEMSSLERSWLTYLIKKGLRVRVEAELSGSGGYINAKNIILLGKVK